MPLSRIFSGGLSPLCHQGLDGNMFTAHDHPCLEHRMHFHHIAPKMKKLRAREGKEDTCPKSHVKSGGRLGAKGS